MKFKEYINEKIFKYDDLTPGTKFITDMNIILDQKAFENYIKKIGAQKEFKEIEKIMNEIQNKSDMYQLKGEK